MVGEIPAVAEAAKFIALTPSNALALMGIGLLGGILSGFLGSGGAFIMTPAMMGLGIPGILAVAANITHKFGKAMQGARKHNELGNVDKKLGLVMFLALFAGVKLAFVASSGIFKTFGEAGSNLYINAVFVVLLSFVTVFMYLDIKRTKDPSNSTPGVQKAPKLLAKFNVPPILNFPVAQVKASLWFVLLIGLGTGYLAGTIGVGGFIGVPAMIYLLGMSPRIAAGTELFLAIFSGAYGAFLYTLNGYLDIRIVLLLYLGSLIGVNIGAICTKVISSLQIRMVMATVVGRVAVSRAITIPGNLKGVGYLNLTDATLSVIHILSNVFLFGSGIISVSIVIYLMLRQFFKDSSQSVKDTRS